MENDIVDVIQNFKNARNQLVELFEIFPVEHLDDPLFDDLTIKQLMRRILVGELFLLAVFEDFRNQKEILWEEPFEFEESISYPDLEWDDLYDDLVLIGDRLYLMLETYPPKLWDKQIWKEQPLTPKKILEIDFDYYENNYLPEVLSKVEEFEE